MDFGDNIDENALTQILNMGFPEADSRKALKISSNNVESAVNLLLSDTFSSGGGVDNGKPSTSELNWDDDASAQRGASTPDLTSVSNFVTIGFIIYSSFNNSWVYLF